MATVASFEPSQAAVTTAHYPREYLNLFRSRGDRRPDRGCGAFWRTGPTARRSCRKLFLHAVLGSVALIFCAQHSHADGLFVSFAVGHGTESLDASTWGVNHPTRCDSLLYSDREDAPSDAACTDDTPREFFGGSFDLGSAFVGSASVGHAWDRVRIEAELLVRSHASASVPAVASTGNVALHGKQSEWSPHTPPAYRISDFRSHQLFVNVHYVLAAMHAWTPYVGAGAGFARVSANYSGSYLRRTIAEGYVQATGGDPAQPADWQLAGSGSVSALEVEVDDTLLGYQLFIGIDRALSEHATFFAMVRWSGFEEANSNDLWTTVRSHTPVHADGVTPFRTDQAFDGIGGFAATVGLRYSF